MSRRMRTLTEMHDAIAVLEAMMEKSRIGGAPTKVTPVLGFGLLVLDWVLGVNEEFERALEVLAGEVTEIDKLENFKPPSIQ